MARISRSTLAMAWSWAALRRDRKMSVFAINSWFAVRRSLFGFAALDTEMKVRKLQITNQPALLPP
jgi:hypothetical protein